MKKQFLTFALAILIATPVSATAVSISELNIQIADLLAKVFNLQAQFNRTDFNAPAPTPSISSDLSCLRLSRDLAQGDRGYDVTELQLFLSRNSYIYPEATISGYFGSATTRAMQRYQVAEGIVAYGSPNTTGYGVAGPRTRAAMSRSCPPPATAANTAPVADPSVLVSPIQAKPMTGDIPFGSVVKFTLSDKCVSYHLDWGDGTAPLEVDNRAVTCDGVPKEIMVNHIFPRNGVYTTTLRAGKYPATSQLHLSLPVVSYKAVVAGGTAKPFSLSTTEGPAPLSVAATFSLTHPACTSYSIDWGDTHRDDFEVGTFACSENLTKRNITHVYSEPGTYTVSFRKGFSTIANLPVIEQWLVTVEDLAAGKTIVNVSETNGYAPVTVTVDLSGTHGHCSSYDVDWGDGSGSQRLEYVARENSEFHADDFVTDGGDFVTEEETCRGPYKRTFTHTYVTYGTYPLNIKFGKGLLSGIDTIQHWVSVFAR